MKFPIVVVQVQHPADKKTGSTDVTAKLHHGTTNITSEDFFELSQDYKELFSIHLIRNNRVRTEHSLNVYSVRHKSSNNSFCRLATPSLSITIPDKTFSSFMDIKAALSP